MTFELTDRLLNEIQSALDNQKVDFFVDAEQNIVVEKDSIVKDKSVSFFDSERYYELPEWTSASGFKMREDFVNLLYSPIAREELQEVLHSGRGVFRNFKDVLKKYPEVEKRWHSYKNRIMFSYINEWYNELREIWGLEKLDYIPESDESLVYDDFTFGELLPQVSREEILQQVSASYRENAQNLPDELKEIFFELWKEKFLNAEEDNQNGFICRSLSDDFAGCITFAPILKKQEKAVTITSLFVPENFRGLGIGTELLSMCLSELKKRGVKWLLLPDLFLPETIQPLLSRTGFEKMSSGYALKIQ